MSNSKFLAVGIGVEAMKEVAKAYQARSLQDFQSTLSAYKEELVDDAVVHLHLSRLYDTLLEQNLCRLIEPYSRVEIEYLAKLIKLPTKAVLTKLSQVTLCECMQMSDVFALEASAWAANHRHLIIVGKNVALL